MKLVPAGVSKKTGKPYNAFFSCDSCKKTFNPADLVGGQQAGYPKSETATSSFSANKEQQRAWGKSKNLQIGLAGIIQAIISSGVYNDRLNQQDHSGLIKLAATIRHQIEEFADSKVGFDRAAEQLSSGDLILDDIPF